MVYEIHIVCVCCGLGFPNGMAPTSRIKMIGKGLVTEGSRFTVLNIGAGPLPNPVSRGNVEGINFEFLPGRTTRPGNYLLRKWIYVRGLQQAGARLIDLRRKEKNLCVYSWFDGGRFSLFHRFLRMIHCPVIHEINEWWPGKANRANLTSNMALTQGALAISKPIVQRLENLSTYSPAYKILRLPILIDPLEWAPVNPTISPQEGTPPYMLWCGNIAQSQQDIEFLLRVLKKVNASAPCHLLLAGACETKDRENIRNWARKIELPPANVEFTGFVPDQELRRLMSGAAALALPLWDTERSICRFPTKLGHYLCSAAPVVSSRCGDLVEYLQDGKSVLFAAPGSVEEFADKITLLLRDRRKALAIGRAGREAAIRNFSVQANQSLLNDFFRTVTAQYSQSLNFSKGESCHAANNNSL